MKTFINFVKKSLMEETKEKVKASRDIRALLLPVADFLLDFGSQHVYFAFE